MVLQGWASKWERMWPGIFYVGVSRAAERTGIILDSVIDETSLKCIGSSKQWKDQNTECEEIKNKALEQRTHDLQNHFGTPSDLKQRLGRFILNMRHKTSHLPDDDVKTAILSQLQEYEEDLGNFQ